MKIIQFTVIINFAAGAIAITGGQFSDFSVSVLVGSVQCSGNESSLLQCSYESDSHPSVSDCDPNHNAAVTCQGKSSHAYIRKYSYLASLRSPCKRLL